MNSSRKLTVSVVTCLICMLIFSPYAFSFIFFDLQTDLKDQKNLSPIEHYEQNNETIKLSQKSTNLSYEDYYPNYFLLESGVSGLLRDQDFNTTEFWNWTSSQNITSTKTSTNLTMFQHVSPENPIYFSNHSYNASDWNFLDGGQVQTGDITNTYSLDSDPFHFHEEKIDGIYQLEIMFNFTGLNQSHINFEVNMYVQNTGNDNNFIIKILNHSSQSFDSLDTFANPAYAWVNNSFDNGYVDSNGNLSILIQDSLRTGDNSGKDDFYIDYLEMKSDNVSYDLKTFNQISFINQSFKSPEDSHLIYNFSIKYRVENFTSIDSCTLQARIWNESMNMGIVWENNIISTTGEVVFYKDISNFLRHSGVYNLSIGLNLTLNTPYESNITMFLDYSQILTNPVSTLLQQADNNSVRALELHDNLNFEMNLSIPAPESINHLNFSLYSLSLNDTFYVQLYNFSTFSWEDFATLDATNWNWRNFSIEVGVSTIVNENNITMLKITDKDNYDGFNGLIEVDFLQVRRYAIQMHLNNISTPIDDVLAGDDAVFIVKLNDSNGNPITNAALTINYTDDSYFIQDNENGNYTLTFYTALATQGNKQINVTAYKNYYTNTSLIINFTVIAVPTNITITQGALNLGNDWITNPQPFVNDTSKTIRIFFNSSIGGLKKAQINAIPQWSNTTPFSYRDLGISLGTTYNGYYDIKLNTMGLHAQDNYLVSIIATKTGYLTANLTLNLTVSARNSTLTTTGFENITVYEEDIAVIGTSFIDTITNSPIILYSPQQGNITWELEQNPSINGSLELFIWSYKAELDVNSIGIEPGKYNITIKAIAKDYDTSETKVELNVLPKNEVELIFLNMPQEVISGNYFFIGAKLRFINGSPIEGEKLNFIVTFSLTGESYEISLITNTMGIAQFQFSYTGLDGVIFISVVYDGNYQLKNVESKTSVNGITLITLMLRSSPIWGVLLAIAAISISIYYFRYQKPKKEKQINEQKQLLKNFEDVNNLLYILILYKKGGILIHEYAVKTSSMNPVLVGGYLQAISTFRDEILKTEKKKGADKWELDYHDIKIYWISGDLTYFIILSEKNLTYKTKLKLDELIKEFEINFKDELSGYTGNVDEFKPADELIKNILELNLNSPLKINWKKIQESVGISRTQAALIELASSMEKEEGNFLMLKLLNTASSARGEMDFVIFNELYALWKKSIFYPIETSKLDEKKESKKIEKKK